jgi:hypothetical protein
VGPLVSGDGPVRVPVGPGSERWVTVAAERTVLAVARTVTSTLRVLDAVASLSGDHRVQVVFAVNDSSPFVAGVRRLLDAVGALVVPWSQLSGLKFDLVVTASENTELAGLDATAWVFRRCCRTPGVREADCRGRCVVRMCGIAEWWWRFPIRIRRPNSWRILRIWPG